MSGPNSKYSRRHYMAAVVLGTAISALGIPEAMAKQLSEPGNRVVADISRYCTTSWRNAHIPADCWGDCTQDVLSRLIQNVKASNWERVFRAEGYERQEFLRAIDAVKKRTQRRLKRTRSFVGIVPDHRASRETGIEEMREVVDRAAGEVLSERQQSILKMLFEGWSVQDISTELAIGPERVSDEKYKAIKKLREHLQVSSAA